MHEKVQAYLEKKQSLFAEKEKKEKNDLLIALGLYEKEYSPTNTGTAEYSLYEWNNTEKKTYYYKQVPIEVTDEEFKEIKYWRNIAKDGSNTNNENTIATCLTVIAWILFIGGFIAGIALGNVEAEGYYRSHTEFSFGIALIYWSISLISGLLFLGFSEVIKLLTAIKNKQ